MVYYSRRNDPGSWSRSRTHGDWLVGNSHSKGKALSAKPTFASAGVWISVVVASTAGIALWTLWGPGLVVNWKVSAASLPPGFAPTVENKRLPPVEAPEGMVWVAGGEFSMGAADPPGMDEVGMKGTLDSRPIHRVYVDGFWMDKTHVTNEEFEKFSKSTGYLTVAERTPSAEQFPGAPPENLVAGS